MAMKPIVDGIERDHVGELAVLRLNVQDPESQPWMERYPFQYTPTFIFIDGQGQELWRTVEAVDPQEVAASLLEVP